MGDIERNLQSIAPLASKEKTFMDKILARQDIEAVRLLIKKEKLKREELLEIMYLLASSELKLVNLNDWSRHVVMKYSVWVGQFVKLAERLYDYKDYIEGMHINIIERIIKHNKIDTKKIPIMSVLELFEEKSKYPDRTLEINITPEAIDEYTKKRLSSEAMNVFEQCEQIMDHDAKFLANLFFIITRSSLSEGAKGFTDLLTTSAKTHVEYQGLEGSMKHDEKPQIIKPR